jgi:hypothetical protein
MERWNLILLLVLAAGLAIGAGVSMLHNGLSARATPTAMEAMRARNARHLAIPANARNERNPVTPSDQNLPVVLRSMRRAKAGMPVKRIPFSMIQNSSPSESRTVVAKTFARAVLKQIVSTRELRLRRR